MRVEGSARRSAWSVLLGLSVFLLAALITPAQQMVTETRDPKQAQDEEFAKLYKGWTGDPQYGSPLVDHLPLVEGIPTPKDVLGYYIGAPQKLTYYSDMLKFYRALEAATPRVKVETIGRSDEGRELVVVWVSSEENMQNLQQNRDNLAKLADPRGLSDDEIHRLIATTKPHYHVMGGLHSGGTRAVRNVDGVGLSDCSRNVSADHSDPRQRIRVGHTGCRRRRSRSQRRLVLSWP